MLFELIGIPLKALIDALNMTLLMLVLVIIDTITAWTVIVMAYNKDFGYQDTFKNVLRGVFFRAWTEGYLESGQFRRALGHKSEAYGVCILVAVFIYLFPDYVFMGLMVDETIALFIYLALILAEGFSIAENLKELGVEHIDLVERAFKAVMRKYGITEERKGNDNERN